MHLRLVAACLLLLSFRVAGQSTPGSISGTITDPDGAPLANAEVKAKNDGGAEFRAKASSSGSYSLTALPAGNYQLTVASPGMAEFHKQDVSVQAGQSIRVDARLADFPSLGSVGEDRQFYAHIYETHESPKGPAPRTPQGKPDFSGVWNALRTIDAGKPDPLPWAAELAKQRAANNFKDLPSGYCLPAGILGDGRLLSFRIMQNDSLLAFIFEEDLPRQIYLDGRKHPEESLSPFIGHSVGKWDGDTLVVDVVGFNDKPWLDSRGHPQTEKLHITQRIQRKDLGHLDIETTIDDPGAFKSPWTMKETTELAGADEEIGQYVCTENNRDVQHLVGK